MSTTVSDQLYAQHHDPEYIFLVDEQKFHVSSPTITGVEIMEKAGIPREVGLLLLLEDGTQRTVSIEEVITVETQRHFKKPPRFKRGRR